jgi:hypothetical protein
MLFPAIDSLYIIAASFTPSHLVNPNEVNAMSSMFRM